jgi:stage V sporulation protein G
MTITRLFLIEKEEGNTRAFLDLTTNEGVVLKGFKLVQGPSGLFLAAPSTKGKDGKWYNTVIIPKDLQNELNKNAVSEYDRLRTSNNTGNQNTEVDQKEEDLPF